MKPEFWIDDTTGVLRQLNGLTAVEYHFSSLVDTKKAKNIMYNYVEKWARKRSREPLYPEHLINECKKQGIMVVHVQSGRA